MLGGKHYSWRLALLDYEKGIGLNLGSRKGSRGLGTVVKGFMISIWSSLFCEKVYLVISLPAGKLAM